MSDQDLHGRVGEWARRQPDATAVAAPGGRTTYRQLDIQARELATSLVAAGVGPGQPVLVLAHPGLDLVTAQLAALHAGAHFVSAPPDHPTARLQAIVASAPPAALVVDAATAAQHDVAALAPGVPVLALADP